MLSMFKPPAVGNGRQPPTSGAASDDKVQQSADQSSADHDSLLGLVALVRHARSLVEAFDGEIQGTVGTAVKEGEQVDAAAAESISAMTEISSRASVVSTASQVAGSNVGTVAAAAEELAASGREVSSLVTRASALATDASDKTGHATATIATLADASKAISGIVVFIEELARRTNMLALNATIEAQRAGQAGKGFAVVAGEVKDLANQTASATRDIRDKIAAIQHSAEEATKAIATIGEAVSRIRDINHEVSGAAQEQAKATTEISSSAQAATGRSSEVTDSIGAIAGAAAGALSQSGEVKKRAEAISKRLLDMRDRLGAVLRASKAEGGTLERVPVAIALSVQCGGQRADGELVEIWPEGARFHPAEGSPRLDGPVIVPLPWIGNLSGTAARDGRGEVVVRFEPLDPARGKTFRKLLGEFDVLDLWVFALAQGVADRVIEAFEDGLKRGGLGLEDLFDEDYKPIPDTNPQQYTSRILAFADRVLPGIIDPPLASDKRLIGVVPIDRNGYTPTNNAFCSKPQGPDPVWNAAYCRNRRILPGPSILARKLANDESEAYELTSYIREVSTGEKQMVRKLALPMRLHGRYWGAMHVAYRP